MSRKSKPVDPRIQPVNDTILHRPDIPADSGRDLRRCHGSNTVEAGGNSRTWVRYDLPRRGSETRTCLLDSWRDWAARANVITKHELAELLAAGPMINPADETDDLGEESSSTVDEGSSVSAVDATHAG